MGFQHKVTLFFTTGINQRESRWFLHKIYLRSIQQLMFWLSVKINNIQTRMAGTPGLFPWSEPQTTQTKLSGHFLAIKRWLGSGYSHKKSPSWTQSTRE